MNFKILLVNKKGIKLNRNQSNHSKKSQMNVKIVFINQKS